MNPDILKLADILDVNNPSQLTNSARPYTINALKSVGWEEGWRIPGSLKEYFAAIFDVLGLPHSSESLKQVVEMPEVQLTLQKKIQYIYEKDHAEEIARKQNGDLFTNNGAVPDNILQALQSAAVEAATLRDPQEKPITEEDEEDFSDLEGGDEDDSSDDSIDIDPDEEPKPPIGTICPCCHWDTAQEYHEMEKDPDDARNFLLYVMGGPSFKKEFKLWNGMCTVTLQTIGNAEEELFSEQYAKEYAENKLVLSTLLQHKHNKYHLALSLYEIQFEGVDQPSKVPSIWAPTFDPTEEKTRMQQFMEKWYNTTITSFELQKTLFNILMDFNRYVDGLSQEMYRKDFWNGVTSG